MHLTGESYPIVVVIAVVIRDGRSRGCWLSRHTAFSGCSSYQRVFLLSDTVSHHFGSGNELLWRLIATQILKQLRLVGLDIASGSRWVGGGLLPMSARASAWPVNHRATRCQWSSGVCFWYGLLAVALSLLVQLWWMLSRFGYVRWRHNQLLDPIILIIIYGLSQ